MDTATPRHDQRLLAWRGPHPHRVDCAHVQLDSDSLTAHGTSLTSDYTLDYRLATGLSWVTDHLDIRSRGEGWWRSLTLHRDDAGVWTARWDGRGARTPDDPVPGLPDLDGALDCDIGLCPLTNTMPILRHDLVGAAHAGRRVSVDLVMAFVAVPDLTIVASHQRYRAAEPVESEGGALIHYASERFSTTLEVDATGLVVTYPGLGRRIELGAPAGRP
jgi:hypothetical protein